VSSLKEIQPKLCINCKHFIQDNENGKCSLFPKDKIDKNIYSLVNFMEDSKFGKCPLFPKDKISNIYSLINRVEQNTDYFYCATTREIESMCGKEGKLYKKKSIEKNVSNDKRE